MNQLSKTSPIRVRVGDWQDKIEKEAKQQQTSVSNIVRQAINLYFLNTDKLDAVANLAKELEQLRRDLYRVGSNLNQIATAINTEQALDQTQLAETQNELKTRFKTLMEQLKEVDRNVARIVR